MTVRRPAYCPVVTDTADVFRSSGEAVHADAGAPADEPAHIPDSLAPVVPRPTVSGGQVFEGLSYALRPGYRPLLLDLWTPPRAPGGAPPPLVLWLHGGGLLSGDRRYLPDTLAPGSVFEALTAAGLAVASPDYRLAREAPYPAQLDDLRAALAYLRVHACGLGVDPTRLGLWGE